MRLSASDRSAALKQLRSMELSPELEKLASWLEYQGKVRVQREKDRVVEMIRVDPRLNRACTTCGAKPGKPCLNRDGTPKKIGTYVHLSRRSSPSTW